MNSSLKLVSGWQRFLLIVPTSLILLGTIAGFCWFFANSLAANAKQPNVAAAAISLSPADPLAHSQLAAFKTRSFVSADLSLALSEFERAAALSPNDYRYWFALARARERAGDSEAAMQSARRAVELAPHYAQVLWLDGNILLRRGDDQPTAFAQMRRAAEADPQFAIHFVNTVAQTLQTQELKDLQQIIGDTVPIRVALLTYLMQNKNLAAAVRIWQELPDKEKRETGAGLSKALIEAKKYRDALSVYSIMAADETEKPMLGRFLNGSFESDLMTADKNPFVWQIGSGEQPQIALYSSAKHTGERSLIAIYNSLSSSDFRSIEQTIVVENNAIYHFETWVKTEKLQEIGGAALFWEAVDADGKSVLAKTSTITTGDNDWQKLTIDFKTNSATEAVTFRFVRAGCSQPLPCSITGKILFDDFALQQMDK